MGGSSKSMLLPFNMPPIAKSGMLGMLSGAGGGGVPPVFYRELIRKTLTSASDTIDSGTFDASKNLLILGNFISAGNIKPELQFNSETGTEYSRRGSQNGASDSTETSANYIDPIIYQGGTGNSILAVTNVVNETDEEKLSQTQACYSGSEGAGTATDRTYFNGKFVDSSNDITSVQYTNTEAGDFASGSQIIILGSLGGADTVWELIGTASVTSGNTLETDVFTTKKFIYFQAYIDGAVGSGDPYLRANQDSGNNYSYRVSNNGGSDYTGVNQTYWQNYGADAVSPRFIDGYILNQTNEEKLAVFQYCDTNNDGAGNAPERQESNGKYSPSDLSTNITRLGFYMNTGNFEKAELRVYGFD